VAITYVGGVKGGRAGATTTTSQSLSGTLTGGTASSPATGDLVVILVSAASASGYAPTTLAISSWSNGTFRANTGVTNYSYQQYSYKFMGGTPDTSITIPSSGNARNAQRWAVHVFRGVDSTTPLDGVTPAFASGTASGRPNPSSVTPNTAGAWILWMGASAAGAGTLFTAPTGFTTNWLGDTTPDTYDVMDGFGYYTGWTTGAYDPAAITAGGTTGSTDSWVAQTIVLKPELNQTITQSSTFTNSNTLNYSHTVTTGEVTLTASLFTNSNTLDYAHTLSQAGGAQDLTQSSTYSNSATYYTHIVSLGLVQASLDSGNPWFDLTTDSANTWATYPTPFNEQVFYKPSISLTLTQSSRYDLTNGLTYQHTLTTGEVTLTQSSLYQNDTTYYTHVISQGNEAQNLTQSSTYSNDQTYYTHTLTTGEVALTADLFTNTNGYYTHTLTTGPVALTQTATYTNDQTYYGHTVTTGPVTLVASRYDNDSTFYTHALTTGPVTLTASLFTNAATYYTHTVTTGPVTITQDSTYTNTQTFYTHDVQIGATNLIASRYDNSQTFYDHSVTTGTVTLTAFLFTNINTYYDHTATTGQITLTQDSTYANVQTFYAHTLQTGTVTLTAARYDNSQTFYEHALTVGTVTLTADLYTDEDTFYGHTVSREGYLEPELFVNSNTFYTHVVAIEQFLVPVRYDNVTSYLNHDLYKQYPDPSQVRIGVQYGQPGLTFTGTNTNVYDGSPKIDIISGKLVKPVTNKVIISLT
jgi:hypothetical protein